MKHLFSSYAKLVALAACALTLGSCNRAEYAMLPKTSSYHGVARVAAPVPVEPAAAPGAEKTEEVAPVASAPAAPASAPAAAPVKPEAVAAASTAQAAAATTVATPAPARKLNLVQRLAVAKVSKQLDKKLQQAARPQHSNAASITALDAGLRNALLVILVGIIVAAFSGVAGIFGVIGGIIGVVGLVLLVLYLLDKV